MRNKMERMENVIDYDFWFIQYIKESVIELAGKDMWEDVLNLVSSKMYGKYNT